MILRLAKPADGRVILTFVRPDGSETTRDVSPIFVHHELMHYAVETILALDAGLLGLIARGRTLADFDAAARNWLPLEAHHAEAIVCALEAEITGSATEPEFATNLKAICDDVGVPGPEPISSGQLALIRDEFRQLAAQWRVLPDDSVFELPWELDASLDA
jgi:hypothetical protein